MKKRQLVTYFPLVFTSVMIAMYYNFFLKKERKDAGDLGLLLETFWYGPRFWKISSFQRYHGKSYVARIEKKFYSDDHGTSVLTVLEDERALNMQHCREIEKIYKLGGGRCLHAGEVLIFSAQDNADESTVFRRDYKLLESLTDNLKINSKLYELNSSKLYSTQPIFKLLEKISLLFSDIFCFEGISAKECGFILKNVNLKLADYGLGDCKIGELSADVEPGKNSSTIVINLHNIGTPNNKKSFEMCLIFNTDWKNYVYPLTISVKGDGAAEIDVKLETETGNLNCINVTLKNLERWKSELVACIGEENIFDYLKKLTGDEKSINNEYIEVSTDTINNIINAITVGNNEGQLSIVAKTGKGNNMLISSEYSNRMPVEETV